MVKILGICGSPKKRSNTLILLGEALEAAREKGAETDVIRLIEKDIKPCNDDHICEKKKICPIKDDFLEVFDKMVKADGLLFGSPVYCGGVTPWIKSLIDRATYYNSWVCDRDIFTGKVGAAIVVGGSYGFAPALYQIYHFILGARMILPGITGPCYGIGTEPGDVLKEPQTSYGYNGVMRARELGRVMTYLAKLLKENPIDRSIYHTVGRPKGHDIPY